MARPKCQWITEDGTRCKRNATHGDRCGHSNHWGPQKNSPSRKNTTRARATASAPRSNKGARSKPPQQRVRAVPTPTYRQTSPRKPATTAVGQQAPRPYPPSGKEQERKQVEKTAELCADLISGGWQETVADRVVGYAPKTWGRLQRSTRRRTCKALARMASFILKTKTLIHTWIGKVFGWFISGLWAGNAIRAFVKELVSNVPLPLDTKMIAVARSLQVAGILLCMMDGKNLEQCDCFVHLVHTETEEQVKKLLVAGMSDWANLACFRFGSSQTAAGKVA